MVRQRIFRVAFAGFTLAELVVVVGIVGVLSALSVPMFLGYWRTSTLKAGAQELVALLAAARQTAIKENVSVCVASDASAPTYGAKVKYVVGASRCTATTPTTSTCARTANTTPCVWTGAGTSSEGYVALSNGVRVLSPVTPVSFTSLGGVGTGGTFTVKHPVGDGTATVTVAVSGRMSVSFP